MTTPIHWDDHAEVEVWARAKRGHLAEEYEDAAYRPSHTEDVLAVGIADGATETAFAASWARLLAEAFAAIAAGADAEAAVKQARRQWARLMGGRMVQAPWYVAAKAEEGAGATALGLALRAEASWAAVAVGDCLLAHERDGAWRQTWPFDDPAAFTNTPPLVMSRTPGTHEPRLQAGHWQPGDRFWLATDALGAWLLTAAPARRRELAGPAFEAVLDEELDAGRLRNDDHTLLRVSLRP